MLIDSIKQMKANSTVLNHLADIVSVNIEKNNFYESLDIIKA